MTATFTVANTGSRAGTDVVPVYVHRPVDDDGVLSPAQRLAGFTRVNLAAGESRTVHVTFRVAELATTPATSTRPRRSP